MIRQYFEKAAIPARALLSEVSIVLWSFGPGRRERKDRDLSRKALVDEVSMEANDDLHVFAHGVRPMATIFDPDSSPHPLRQEPSDGNDEIASHEGEDAGEDQKRTERGECDAALRETAH